MLVLVKAICASCGMDAEPIVQQVKGNHVLDSKLLHDLISSIDAILLKLGKKWIFVFDQINKLFVKPSNIHAKDASGLDFPFHYIRLVMKPTRITSVISASANNEMAYKERHEGFLEYNHTCEMTKTELIRLYNEIDETNVDMVLFSTSGVPFFVADLVEKEFDTALYEEEVIEAARDSLRRLKTDPILWDEVLPSTLSVLLLIDSPSDRYDKKFLVQERQGGNRYLYKPLVQQVLTGYRSYVWKQLMTYVEEKESLLLQVCSDPDTTNRVRGCHFETMVLRRCSSSDVDIQVGGEQLTIPSGAQMANGFAGRLLPKAPMDGLHFPFDPNFPAIDFFLKKGRYVFAVQVHVAEHDDVANGFAGLCRQAGWFQRFDSIHLIYLSPEDAVRDLVGAMVTPPHFDTAVTRHSGEMPYRIARRAVTKDSFTCLRDLQWPEGCSIDSS